MEWAQQLRCVLSLDDNLYLLAALEPDPELLPPCVLQLENVLIVICARRVQHEQADSIPAVLFAFVDAIDSATVSMWLTCAASLVRNCIRVHSRRHAHVAGCVPADGKQQAEGVQCSSC